MPAAPEQLSGALSLFTSRPEVRHRFRDSTSGALERHDERPCSTYIYMSLLTDFRYAMRSLARVKGLAITVVVTLALGIGANAAIFSVVRGVLLRPLVNRDQDRLIYIRQTARGAGMDNANFSVPELKDLQRSVKSLTAFGDFSTIEFTMLGLGEPRSVRAGVVGGSYFDVMGLRSVMGRLLNA